MNVGKRFVGGLQGRREGDEGVEGENKNAFHTCLKMSKNKFNKLYKTFLKSSIVQTN